MISISSLQHVTLMASQPTNLLMGSLSKVPASLIPPHYYPGTQLDYEGNTADPDKELRNLQKTENPLPDIWPNAIYSQMQ